MEIIPDWQTLQQMIAKVPRQSREYSTTLYAGPSQIQRWCSAGEMRALVADGALLVVRTDRGFDRVYHISTDRSSLVRALSGLPVRRYVADLIGREAPLDQLCSAYAASGFSPHAFLRRMSRTTRQSPFRPYEDASIARPEEAAEVAAFLAALLDPLSEQLPTTDELHSAAIQGRLLIVRRGTALSGMLMYDLQGRLAHLRFWHVHPDAQGAGIGRSLMGAFLASTAEAQRHVLWVLGDNDRSIAIYRHYGFEVDGLLDRIMVSNEDENK